MVFFNFEKLVLWQKSRQFVMDVYNICKQFPDEERFGLTMQVKRAVVSVSSNIAEGAGRFSQKEKLHFLSIAYGSLTEVCCQLTLACDLGFINNKQLFPLLNQAEEIGRIMSGYRCSIKKQNDE